MSELIQIVTSASEVTAAERIATSLVEQRLAACAQVSGPIESRYWWNNQIETAQEWLCTAKTLRRLYAQVEQVIREHHPYDEPEILATPVVAASEGYAKWIEREVRHGE